MLMCTGVAAAGLARPEARSRSGTGAVSDTRLRIVLSSVAVADCSDPGRGGLLHSGLLIGEPAAAGPDTVSATGADRPARSGKVSVCAVNNLDGKAGYSIGQSMASVLSATRCQQPDRRCHRRS